MSNSNLTVICKLTIVFLFVGCERSADDFRDSKFETEVAGIVQDVCEGKCQPRECGVKLMQSIVNEPDVIAQKRKRTALLNAVSRATFTGDISIERESGYFRLHDFLGGVSIVLREHGNEWGMILELWFSEIACHKKETVDCERESKRLLELSKQTADFDAAMKIARKSDELEHCAQYSACCHELDMSLFVLWDDSVAARYCATLSHGEKMKVVHRIKDAIGRYPDWYMDEQKKGKKRSQKAGGTGKQRGAR